jgi:hypothetical protein
MHTISDIETYSVLLKNQRGFADGNWIIAIERYYKLVS